MNCTISLSPYNYMPNTSNYVDVPDIILIDLDFNHPNKLRNLFWLP